MEAARAAAPGGSACPTTIGPPSSSRPPNCSPGRGGTRWPRPRCSARARRCYQAEIDTPCELVDFWRFNVHFGRQILEEQPISSPGVWNRFDHRPLEGFVLAITPFNFTAIAGNLPTAPALMGNTVLWKPSPTQQLAAHYTMRLLEAAGLPPGVINMVTGDGRAVSDVALVHPDLAGIHFTGSSATFGHLWRTVTENLTTYRAYPRLVGETGGKDFVDRPPLRRRRRAAYRTGAGGVRVPGAEVLGGLPGLHSALGVGSAARRVPRRGRGHVDGRHHRLLQVPRRGHRPALLRSAHRRPRPGPRRVRRRDPGRRHRRRQRGLLRPSHRRPGRQPRPRDLHHRVLRAVPRGVRLRRRRLRPRRSGRLPTSRRTA